MIKTTFENQLKLLDLISGDRIDQDDLFEAQDLLCNMLVEDSTLSQKKQLCKRKPAYFYQDKKGAKQ